jgi:hypothetical protein
MDPGEVVALRISGIKAFKKWQKQNMRPSKRGFFQKTP